MMSRTRPKGQSRLHGADLMMMIVFWQGNHFSHRNEERFGVMIYESTVDVSSTTKKSVALGRDKNVAITRHSS